MLKYVGSWMSPKRFCAEVPTGDRDTPPVVSARRSAEPPVFPREWGHEYHRSEGFAKVSEAGTTVAAENAISR